MNRRSTLLLVAASVSLAFAAGEAAAQATAKSVAGTYTAVSVPAFGDKPRGQMVLTANGRYSIVVAAATLPKVAAGARNKGTPAENKAVVDGSIAHYGRFAIEDGGKTITFHIEGSTFPNWDGTTQKRPLKSAGETLTYTVTAPSTGGAANDVTWKLIK